MIVGTVLADSWLAHPPMVILSLPVSGNVQLLSSFPCVYNGFNIRVLKYLATKRGKEGIEVGISALSLTFSLKDCLTRVRYDLNSLSALSLWGYKQHREHRSLVIGELRITGCPRDKGGQLLLC